MEVLAEPGTGDALKLSLTRHAGQPIEEGTLTAEGSGRVYSMRGISRFVEADPLGSAGAID